jgi:NADPH-dependent 2,4-dienoyl-CoA reductase/sulfur reductase-like enzyme
LTELRSVAVVGASLAGLRAVEALRARGFAGRIDWIGDEIREPYDRPPLSKQVLRGEWGPEHVGLIRSGVEIEADRHFGRRAERLDAIDRTIALDGGQRIAFDALVVATGAVPRLLPNQPALDGVFTLRTLDDALAIRAAFDAQPRVVVVGGGFIGAEVAASCRQRGVAVAMVEALGNPLEQALGPELGALYAALHRDHGVDVRTGVAVAALEGDRRVERVRLADGTVLDADVVVVGIGVRPATAWLEGSGLELKDGVVCDATCATNVPGIVAAGDIARWTNPRYGESMRVEHWTNAVEQAQAAVARLLDGPGAKPFAPVPYVWSDQYDTKLAVAGRVRAGDDMRVVDGSLAERKFVAIYGRAGRLAGAVAMNRMRKHLDWRKALAEDISWEEALARV